MAEDLDKQSKPGRNRSLERTFLAVASIFGLVMLFINPPFQAPDEWNHFNRAYFIAQGNARATLDEASGRVGGFMPADLLVIESSIFYAQPFSPGNYSEILYRPPVDWTERSPFQKEFKRRRLAAFRSVLGHRFSSRYKADIFVGFPNTAVYFPTVYAPQALAMAVLSRLDANGILLVYFGRAAALLFWIAVVYAALRITPVHKKSLAALALMPTSLYQAASLSGDTVTNAVAFLFFAIVLSCACGGSRITMRQMAALFSLGLLVALQKYYYFLAAFALFLPKERFGGNRGRLVFFMIFFTAIIAAGWLWTRANSHLQVPVMSGVDHQGQISYILQNPYEISLIMARTLKRFWLEYLHGFSGKLSHYDVRLPLPVSLLYIIGLLSVVLSEARNPCAILPGQKVLAAALVCLGMLLTATLLYIFFTPVGNEVILGIQGRYFIALMPMAFLVPPPTRFIGPLSTRALWAFIIAILTYTVWVLLRGYYLI